MQGFQEAQSAFLTHGDTSYVGQVRRFGPHGPAYEVVSILQNGDLGIEVIQSSERLTYPLVDFLADPVAVTVP
jgi:hypothetical protein